MMSKMKKAKAGLIGLTFSLVNSISVFAANAKDEKKAAGGLASTKLYTGTIALLQDAQNVMLAVEAVLVVALLIWNGIKMQAAEQEEKPKHKKHMISIGIIGVIIIAMTGLVPTILAYYQ